METVSHFINCPHTEHQQIWNNLHEAVYKMHLQQNALPQYYNTLVYGLYIGRGTKPPQHMVVEQEDMQQILQEQATLGWHQLYYGRLTRAWANSIIVSNNTIKGMVFYSRVLLLIWQAVITQWHLHNQHLHPHNTHEEDRTQLE